MMQWTISKRHLINAYTARANESLRIPLIVGDYIA